MCIQYVPAGSSKRDDPETGDAEGKPVDASLGHLNAEAPEGPDLPESFWANAVLVDPPPTRSVHLKIDAEVFQHFLRETGGKGHITRMQNVLRAYVRAKQAEAKRSAGDRGEPSESS